MRVNPDISPGAGRANPGWTRCPGDILNCYAAREPFMDGQAHAGSRRPKPGRHCSPIGWEPRHAALVSSTVPAGQQEPAGRRRRRLRHADQQRQLRHALALARLPDVHPAQPRRRRDPPRGSSRGNLAVAGPLRRGAVGTIPPDARRLRAAYACGRLCHRGRVAQARQRRGFARRIPSTHECSVAGAPLGGDPQPAGSFAARRDGAPMAARRRARPWPRPCC